MRAAANVTGFGTVVTGHDTILVGAPTAFESAVYGAAFLFSPTLDFPPDPQFTLVPTKSFKMRDDTQPPISASRRLVRWKSFTSASSTCRIVPPASGSTGDPTLAGAVLTVYNAAGLTLDSVTLPLPATGTSPGDGWSRAGTTATSTRTAIRSARSRACSSSRTRS